MRDRLFILGCGPSLNTQRFLMPMLGLEDTFCCNRMHLWDSLCFTPTFYICTLGQVARGIEPSEPAFRLFKFILSVVGEAPVGWIPVVADPAAPLGEQQGPLKSGPGITFLMAQLGIRLGYKQIYLLGCEQVGEGHCFDEAGANLAFIPPDKQQTLTAWAELAHSGLFLDIFLRDCTPSGRLNEVLGYVPLEEALGVGVAA